MSEQILKEIQPILNRFAETEPTIKSRFIDFVQLVFRTESHLNQKFDEEMKNNQLLLKTIKNLANYSHDELNSAIASFDKSQDEFKIIGMAIDWQLNIADQGSRST
jgi:hypothetical protein